MMRICVAFFLITVTIQSVSYSQQNTKEKSYLERTRFEPPAGQCLVFVGQDNDTIGGLEDFEDGYCDHFSLPAGLTLYSNLSPGENSYGYITKGNDGIKMVANWGAGDSCAECYVKGSTYDNTMLSLGISMVNHEKQVAKGDHDDLVRELAIWIQSTDRPVFLRLGYEFDGWDWNHYHRKHYLAAWKNVRRIFEELEVENVAFVWQSKGTGSDQKTLEEWYPGDDIVDWCGYSYFGNPDEEMLVFARKHRKPVFIAEASPVYEVDNLFYSTLLSQPDQATRAWDRWFMPFFQTIRENSDVIKAFSYINTNWPEQPMWKANPVFMKVDARIQASEYVSQKWREELDKPMYLLSSPELFEKVGYTRQD